MEALGHPVFVAGMDRPVRSGRVTRPVLLGAAALATGLAGLAWFESNPAERTLRVDASKLTVSAVTAAPFHDFIPLHGEVVPLNSIVLDAEQGGRIEEVLAEAGQRVVAGQPLIRFSDPSLELDAIARETQVIEQINSQRAMELSFELTRTADAKAVADADYSILRLGREVERRRPLAAAGFESREKLDQSADELAYARRLREIAGEALRRDAAVIQRSSELIEETSARLSANLATAKRQLDALMVRAPADGVLTGLDAHIGEEKIRGQHLGQIDRDGGFKVAVQVDEYYLARVKPGQHLAVAIDGAPSDLLVTKVYPQVRDRRFAVDLTWAAATPLGLRRGQAVQGKLELGDDQPAVVLPAGPFLEATGGAWVFVVDADGQIAARRPVRLGRRTAEAVEVLDGLKPGDRVVTSDYTGFDRIDRLAISP